MGGGGEKKRITTTQKKAALRGTVAWWTGDGRTVFVTWNVECGIFKKNEAFVNEQSRRLFEKLDK
jgi:hypothetical protein